MSLLDKSVLKALPSTAARLYADTRLQGAGEMDDFGMEWRSLDPYPRLQLLSQGHLFGRFLLPQAFFDGKAVVDLGCGNGRLGRFMIPGASEYVGVEISDALLGFQVPPGGAGKVSLVRASIEDLPVLTGAADVVVCWGVLHHARDPWAAAREMQRILKPGGAILLYVYPDAFAPRENLNRLFRHLPASDFHAFCEWLLATLRRWHELDPYLAPQICRALSVGLRHDTGWELFQTFDGLGPAHHHLLEQLVPQMFPPPRRARATHAGCFRIE